jgi:hypothetical protein
MMQTNLPNDFFSNSDHLSVLKETIAQRNLNATSQLLISLSTDYYLNYSMSDASTFNKMSQYANLELRKIVIDNVKVKDDSEITSTKKIKFWIRVMDDLIQKKDFLSAVMISLSLVELAYGAAYKDLFSEGKLPLRYRESLANFDMGKLLRTVKSLPYYTEEESPGVRPIVPFHEIFSLVKEMVASKDNPTGTVDKAIEKLTTLDSESKQRAWDFKKNAYITAEKKFSTDLSNYIAKHTKSTLTMSVEKLQFAERIRDTLNDPEKNFSIKLAELTALFEEGSKNTHYNPLRNIQGKEPSLIKSFRPFLFQLQMLNITKNITEKNLSELIQNLYNGISNYNEKKASHENNKSSLTESAIQSETKELTKITNQLHEQSKALQEIHGLYAQMGANNRDLNTRTEKILKEYTGTIPRPLEPAAETTNSKDTEKTETIAVPIAEPAVELHSNPVADTTSPFVETSAPNSFAESLASAEPESAAAPEFVAAESKPEAPTELESIALVEPESAVATTPEFVVVDQGQNPQS